MPRGVKLVLLIMGLLVAFGLLSLQSLQERVNRLGQPERPAGQMRQELAQPTPAVPEKKERVRLFWGSASGEALSPVDVELALASDPAERARQLIEALITRVPSDAQRTLPRDATLLEFYLLPGGTAIADFSGALATATPSGILSEQLTVDSLRQTLAANVPRIRRLKILISGQESDTVAGHVDLTDFFDLTPQAGAQATTAAPAPAPANPPGGPPLPKF